jgi:PAS domain S-box-containing protein
MKTLTGIGNCLHKAGGRFLGVTPRFLAGREKGFEWSANPGATAICIGLVYVVLVGCVNLMAPTGLDLQFLYLIGCAFVGWRVGARAAMGPVLVSGVFVLWDASRAGRGLPAAWVMYWNILIRLIGLAAAGWLASEAGRLTRHLDRAVRARTASLQKEMEEHRETAAGWREMAQLFRQLTESITEVFWVSDPARTRLNFVSPAYERIWGQPSKAAYLDPKGWLAAVHEADQARVARAIQAGQIAGEFDQEYRVVRPDGTVRWVHDRAFPVKDAQQRIWRLVGIAEDITERIRAGLT